VSYTLTFASPFACEHRTWTLKGLCNTCFESTVLVSQLSYIYNIVSLSVCHHISNLHVISYSHVCTRWTFVWITSVTDVKADPNKCAHLISNFCALDGCWNEELKSVQNAVRVSRHLHCRSAGRNIFRYSCWELKPSLRIRSQFCFKVISPMYTATVCVCVAWSGAFQVVYRRGLS
jgi:hypothetical protein